MTDLDSVLQQIAAAQAAGNLAEADRLYRTIVRPTPELLVNHANLLARMGRHGEALARHDAAIAANPNLMPAHFNRGNVLVALHRPQEALESYDRAVALAPDQVTLWNNRGNALRDLARFAEALASYDRAVALAPGHVNALTNRAIILSDLRSPAQALEAADLALARAPGFAQALYARGNALRELGRPDEAMQAFDATLAADPRHQHALNGLAQAAQMACDWQRCAELKPRVETAVRSDACLIQPLVFLGWNDDPALQRRCSENYLRRLAPRAFPPLSKDARYAHDRIRLAYLSADFHQHATAVLMAELFERHDRSRFEITAVSFGPDDTSPMRARLKRGFDHFIDVRGKTDVEVARMLHAAEIDIAVDLSGHTMGGRPNILAHRPAPVQVNWLVYPGTSGAPFLDTILADKVVLPESQQAFFSETIRHLPHCYQPSDTTRAVGVAPSRADAGLPASGFVFAAFNAAWKLNAPMFDIWMRLLGAVPDSVLWLLEGPARDNLGQEAAARGIDPGRLVFAPKLEMEAHLARHQLADLFLDTLPYNAHTTASDALWAGLPVLTCRGRSFPGRVAASLLTALEMPELITETAEDYEALALALAQGPARLAALRARLVEKRKTAPLFDSAVFCSDLEAAYTAMLRG